MKKFGRQCALWGHKPPKDEYFPNEELRKVFYDNYHKYEGTPEEMRFRLGMTSGYRKGCYGGLSNELLSRVSKNDANYFKGYLEGYQKAIAEIPEEKRKKNNVRKKERERESLEKGGRNVANERFVGQSWALKKQALSEKVQNETSGYGQAAIEGRDKYSQLVLNNSERSNDQVIELAKIAASSAARNGYALPEKISNDSSIYRETYKKTYYQTLQASQANNNSDQLYEMREKAKGLAAGRNAARRGYPKRIDLDSCNVIYRNAYEEQYNKTYIAMTNEQRLSNRGANDGRCDFFSGRPEKTEFERLWGFPEQEQDYYRNAYRAAYENCKKFIPIATQESHCAYFHARKVLRNGRVVRNFSGKSEHYKSEFLKFYRKLALVFDQEKIGYQKAIVAGQMVAYKLLTIEECDFFKKIGVYQQYALQAYNAKISEVLKQYPDLMEKPRHYRSAFVLGRRWRHKFSVMKKEVFENEKQQLKKGKSKDFVDGFEAGLKFQTEENLTDRREYSRGRRIRMFQVMYGINTKDESSALTGACKLGFDEAGNDARARGNPAYYQGFVDARYLIWKNQELKHASVDDEYKKGFLAAGKLKKRADSSCNQGKLYYLDTPERAQKVANLLNLKRYLHSKFDAWNKVAIGPVDILSKENNLQWGVYATENFLSGELVGEYTGEQINFVDRSNFEYVIEQDDRSFISAHEEGNFVSRVNHSASVPNVEFYLDYTSEGKPITYLRTLRRINVGEQLLADYGSSYLFSEKMIFLNPYHSDLSFQEFYVQKRHYYVALEANDAKILSDLGFKISKKTYVSLVMQATIRGSHDELNKLLQNRLCPLELPLVNLDNSSSILQHDKQPYTTSLMVAVRKGSVKSVKLLLKYGADPNLQEVISGKSAMHYILERPEADIRASILSLLLECGGRQSFYDSQKKSPLHMCIDKDYFDSATQIVNVLIKGNFKYIKQLKLAYADFIDPLLYALKKGRDNIFILLVKTLIELVPKSDAYKIFYELEWFSSNLTTLREALSEMPLLSLQKIIYFLNENNLLCLDDLKVEIINALESRLRGLQKEVVGLNDSPGENRRKTLKALLNTCKGVASIYIDDIFMDDQALDDIFLDDLVQSQDSDHDSDDSDFDACASDDAMDVASDQELDSSEEHQNPKKRKLKEQGYETKAASVQSISSSKFFGNKMRKRGDIEKNTANESKVEFVNSVRGY